MNNPLWQEPVEALKVQVADHAKTLEEHGRRISDHGTVLQTHGASLESQAAFIAALRKSTVTQERMIEVGETLIEVMGWVGKAALWITRISTAAGVLWFGFTRIFKA